MTTFAAFPARACELIRERVMPACESCSLLAPIADLVLGRIVPDPQQSRGAIETIAVEHGFPFGAEMLCGESAQIPARPARACGGSRAHSQDQSVEPSLAPRRCRARGRHSDEAHLTGQSEFRHQYLGRRVGHALPMLPMGSFHSEHRSDARPPQPLIRHCPSCFLFRITPRPSPPAAAAAPRPAGPSAAPAPPAPATPAHSGAGAR